MENKKQRGPKSKLGAVLQSLLITAVVGFIYFYVSLPALNLQDSNFYVFVFVLCLVFVISALFTTGFHMDPGVGLKEYFRFIAIAQLSGKPSHHGLHGKSVADVERVLVVLLEQIQCLCTCEIHAEHSLVKTDIAPRCFLQL